MSRALAVLIVSTGILLYLLNDVARAWVGHKTDFGTFYAAARAMRSGRDPYDAATLESFRDEEREYMSAKFGTRMAPGSEPLPYIYPPALALLLIPLTIAGYSAGLGLWFVLNHAFFIASVAILFRAFYGQADPAKTAVVAFVAGVFFPVQFDLDIGQANLLVLMVVSSAFLAEKRERPLLSGALVGLATAIKLTPGLLFLSHAVRGRWKGVAAGVAVVLVLQFAAAELVGWEKSLGWVGLLVHQADRPEIASSANQSLLGFIRRLCGESYSPIRGPGLVGWLWPTSVALLGAATLVALIVKRRSSALLQFSLLLAVALIVSPKSWIHHFVLLLPVYLMLFSECHIQIASVASFVLVGFEFVHFYPLLAKGWPVVLVSTLFIGTVLLYGVILGRLWKSTCR